MVRWIRVVGVALAMLAVAAFLLESGGLLKRWNQALPWSAEAAALAQVPRGVAYVANEGSGTVTVVNTATNRIIRTICLGSDPAIPGTAQPNGPCNADTQGRAEYYNGHEAPSGLSLTPDGSVLLVANRLSGTVVAIDTASHAILGYTPVGREPAVAVVRPGVFGLDRSLEAWVAIRGESYLEVLRLDHDELYDPRLRRTDRMSRLASVDTVLGPSAVEFTSDGQYAFVVSGKQGRVDKIEASTRTIANYRTLDSPWTSFALVTPDDRELYLVQEGASQISVLGADDLEYVAKDVDVGKRPTQVRFVGKLAYVSVAGPAPTTASPNPVGKLVIFDRSTHKVVRELTGSAFAGEPSALLAMPDGRLYVAEARANRIVVVNTGDPDDPMDDKVAGTVSGAAGDLMYLKQPVAIVANP
jgi:YVTN family beta-propeller protein